MGDDSINDDHEYLYICDSLEEEIEFDLLEEEFIIEFLTKRGGERLVKLRYNKKYGVDNMRDVVITEELKNKYNDYLKVRLR